MFADEKCDCRGFGGRLWLLIRDQSVLRLCILGSCVLAHLGSNQSVGGAQRALASFLPLFSQANGGHSCRRRSRL